MSTDGDKIGSIGQVYVDDDNGQPTWVTAKTGLFGTSESFVPLEGARAEGNDIVVPYSKDQVKDAPRVDADGHLEPAEEDRLYAPLQPGGGGQTYTEATAGRDAGLPRSDGLRRGRRGTVGHDTSGPTTDDAMTRSEERLNVGTESGSHRHGYGCASTSPPKTSPRPCRCSVKKSGSNANPSRTPIAEPALSGPDISEEEHEVILHEERPVVEKETVAVERVRLDTETVTDEVTVDEEVRKERIETDGVDNTRR